MYQAELLLHETPWPTLGVLLVQPSKTCTVLHRYIVGTISDLLPNVHTPGTIADMYGQIACEHNC